MVGVCWGMLGWGSWVRFFSVVLFSLQGEGVNVNVWVGRKVG